MSGRGRTRGGGGIATWSYEQTEDWDLECEQDQPPVSCVTTSNIMENSTVVANWPYRGRGRDRTYGRVPDSRDEDGSYRRGRVPDSRDEDGSYRSDTRSFDSHGSSSGKGSWNFHDRERKESAPRGRRGRGGSDRRGGFKGGFQSRTWSSDDSQPSMPPRRGINWGAIHAQRDQMEAEKWKGLPNVIRDFYKEDPAVANMTEDELFEFRLHNHGILVSDLTPKNRPVPNPVTTFQQAFRHYPDILVQLERLGFEKPTPIQSQAWPVIMQGHDMVGIAQTGTGKTLAFLLPGLVHIEGQPTPVSERIGPSALILSPTRELALQIEKEVQKFSYKGIKSVCIYGGASRREQVTIVSKGVEIVIATPGRLCDLQENQLLNLKGVSYLVLDEADRMLDMGFEPQIKKVMLDIRPTRQTIMTSATWPPGVRRLINDYLKQDPFQVTVGTLDLRACALVEQRIEFIEEDAKKARTVDFICQMKKEEKVLIFCSKKSTADDLASDLLLGRFPVQSIHGDREQSDREQALEDFVNGTAPILVATDVASRGLDIKGITYVVNYDFPVHIEDYVHRVGRTGRAGAHGKSLTFMSRSNWRFARELSKILSDANQDVPDELISMAERYEKSRERHRRY